MTSVGRWMRRIGMTEIRRCGFIVRYSDQLVALFRSRCIAMWRRNPKWHLDQPVWFINLPFGLRIEKWTTKDVGGAK